MFRFCGREEEEEEEDEEQNSEDPHARKHTESSPLLHKWNKQLEELQDPGQVS
jgi:hypothetical protein